MSRKLEVFQRCRQVVNQRVETARTAMENAQRAANEESKSSAGDKYETGRAMMQIERDKAAQHMIEGLKLKKVLDEIDLKRPSTHVQLGSLVKTNNGNFFIAIPAGIIELHGQVYYAISLASPLGSKLKNCKVGEQVTFNNQSYKITEIL